MLSVVIPTLNVVGRLGSCLAHLGAEMREELAGEVVVADGGSRDGTLEVAQAAGTRVLTLAPGRGAQLAAGCAAATGDWLLILHADTRLQPGWGAAARRHMAERPGHAGWFRYALDDAAPVARLWETGVALRSRLFGLPYGDQGLLLSRTLYDAVGGYRPLPLMEDVDLVRRIGRGRLAPIGATAVTSADRHRREGYWRRGWRNTRLLARYLAGADPAELARAYE